MTLIGCYDAAENVSGLAEGVVLQTNSLQYSPQPVPGLPLELQSDFYHKPTLPFLRKVTGSNFTKSAFRGKADVANSPRDVCL